MAEDERNELMRELRGMSAELRDGLRLWQESIVVRRDMDRVTLESRKQKQQMACEMHQLAMESQRVYQQHLLEHGQHDHAGHDSDLENHRIWREGQQRPQQQNAAPGRSLLFFLGILFAGWLLWISVGLFEIQGILLNPAAREPVVRSQSTPPG